MNIRKTDEQLVKAALEGDQDAFGELAGRYRNAAFGIAFHKLGDFEAARDTAQDALVRAYLELQKLRDHSKFPNWLYRITLTIAAGALRRQRSTVSLDESSVTGNDLRDTVQEDEKIQRTRNALETLTKPDKLAIILHYIDGYSHEEIGGILNTSVSSVKSRIYRAKRHLREEILTEVEKSLKDERNPEIKDIGLGICWYNTPCHCRCRHCLLDSGTRTSGVLFEKVKALAEKFVRWRNEKGLQDFPVDIIHGYAGNGPDSSDIIRFNTEHGATTGFFYLNGTAITEEQKLREILLGHREHARAVVCATFFGQEETHDAWTGKDGDFSYLIQALEVAASMGYERQESIYVSHQNARELPELIDYLNSLPGTCTRRGIHPWDYRGRGKQIENERVTKDDINALPEEIRQFINLNGWQSYKSESEWIKHVCAGDYAKKDRRYYVISVWKDNIRYLDSTSCDEILRDMLTEDERLYQAVPSLPTLARLYGKKNGKKIYSIRDLEWKWIDCYLKDHPEIDPRGRFSDLDTTILWR